MAFIWERKNKKSTTYYVCYHDEFGRVKRIKTGRTKSHAEKELKRLEAKLDLGITDFEKQDCCLRKFFDEYLQRTEPRQSEGYHTRNKEVVTHFRAFLEAEQPYISRLSQLTPPIIDEYQRWRLVQKNEHTGRPPTKRTVNIEVSSLNTFLNWAVRYKLITQNPMTGYEKLKEDDSKRVTPLSRKQVQTLLEGADGWFEPVIRTAVYTGFREGELIHLTWADVDLDGGFIKIRRKEGWTPKSSGQSIREREVALPPTLVDYLCEHKKKTKSDDDDWVFHNAEGKQLCPGLRKVLNRLASRLGYPELTKFHALRHTFGTFLSESSKDLPVVMKQMGHADIRTTMRYSHATQERQKRAAATLNFEDDKAEPAAS